MTKERLEEIFESEGEGKFLSQDGVCNVFHGLLVIRKFMPNADVEAAEHDIIYSVDIDKLLAAGLTEEGAYMLHFLNWHIEDDSLACYV